MDTPMWYNNRLWQASKQSIDGRPVRSQSASYANRRSGFLSQSVPRNWDNYLKVQNLQLPNRDRYTYRFTFSNRPGKPVTQTSSISSPNSNNNLSITPSKCNVIMPSELLVFQPKSATHKDRLSTYSHDNKFLQLNFPSKTIQPKYVEYEKDFPPKKYDIAHGNMNSANQTGTDSTEKSLEEEIDSLTMSNSVTPVPQNTPRFLDNPNQDIFPRKSILKKTVNLFYQPNFNQNRILTPSLKPMISSQPINRTLELRRNMKSAPATKREVRFNMNINNIIEYSPNE